MDWSIMTELFAGFEALWENPGSIIMFAIGGILTYLAISRKYEPLLLIPISSGIILANLPLGEIVRPATDTEVGGLLWIFRKTMIETEVVPLMIFLGLGALTDFEPLLNYPHTILLGAAAQIGVFCALLGALLLGFDLRGAAAIGIIGGADGPTTIFLASKMEALGGPPILGAVAVAAYSYMALVPIIQPPVIRLLTSKKERMIRMAYAPKPASRLAKILFPIATTIIVGLMVPKAAPLIGMLMFGNLMKECGVVDRLLGAAQNELMNIVTIILGITVGATMPAEVFLRPETIGIFILGLFAFAAATGGGVLIGKLMCVISGGKINPMIGAAGVSAVPMAARVCQRMAQEEDPGNFVIMQAMGPNVAGVIGTATVAGVLLTLVPKVMGLS